jgi:hypothetical protein
VDALNRWNSPGGLVASAMRCAGTIRAAAYAPLEDHQDLRFDIDAGRRILFRRDGETVTSIDSGGTVTAAAFVGSASGLTDLPPGGLLVEGAGGEARMDLPRALDMAMRRIVNVAWPLERDDVATRRFVESHPRQLALWRETPVLAHWMFNESEGPFRDAVAGAHLTALTSDWDRTDYTTAGLVGLAADFNADGGVVKLAQREGRVPGLDAFPYSVSFWARGDEPGDGSFQNVFCLNNSYYDVPQGVGLRNGRICLRDSQTAFYEATTPTVTDGTWRHLVAVFEHNLTGGKRLYVDGVLRFQSTHVTQPFVDDQFAGSDNDYNRVTVGACWRDDLYDPSNPFPGAVDDLRMFATALDESEIAELYNAGRGTEAPLYPPAHIDAETLLIDSDQDTWARLDTGPEGDRIRMAVGDAEIVRLANPPEGPWMRLDGALQFGPDDAVVLERGDGARLTATGDLALDEGTLLLGDPPEPSGRIHIIGGAGGLGDHGVCIDGYGDGASLGGRIYLRHSRGGNVGDPVATWDGESLGFLYYCGVNNAGNFDLGARVQASQSGSAGQHVPARLELIASSDSDPLAAALAVDGPGQRVDIQGALTVDTAATSPAARLLVGGDAQMDGVVYAHGFAVLSTREAKDHIRPAFAPDEANPVRDLIARRYRLRPGEKGYEKRGGENARREDVAERDRLGFVAEEAPPEFRIALPDGRPGVDLMAVVAALVEDHRRLSARVEALERAADMDASQ